MSFYSEEELRKIGLKSYGKNVKISKKASLYNPHEMIIGNNVRIDDFSILSGKVEIGNYVHIAAYSALYGSEGIKLEDFSGISSRVTIYSVSDDYSGNSMVSPLIPDKYKNIEKGKVTLKKHSLLGSGTTVLPGVVVSEGTATGVGTLLKEVTEPWKIYVGIPGKVVKEREKKILELEKLFLKECK